MLHAGMVTFVDNPDFELRISQLDRPRSIISTDERNSGFSLV